MINRQACTRYVTFLLVMADGVPNADPQSAVKHHPANRRWALETGVKPKALGQHEQADKAKQRPIKLVLAALNGRDGLFNAMRMGWLGRFVVGTPHVWSRTLRGKTGRMGADVCD